MKRLNADSRRRVGLTLNGREAHGWAEPRMLLSDILRHEIGATGTHVGCEHGVCGACTVRPRRRPGARLPDAGGAGRRPARGHGGGPRAGRDAQ